MHLVFRKHSDEDWRKFDGVVGGVPGDHQHQLLGRPSLLLLCPAHHQEESRHQADKNVQSHQNYVECVIKHNCLFKSGFSPQLVDVMTF